LFSSPPSVTLFARQHHHSTMDSFTSFTLRKLYRKIHKLGDRLAKIQPLIDWEAFRPIIQPLYDNQGPQGGRPNIDPVVMVKMLVLQQWYGLSDPELERQATDRISFHRFLGFPDVIPDAITVWLFRERLDESGRDRAIWEELQRQRAPPPRCTIARLICPGRERGLIWTRRTSAWRSGGSRRR